jgi:hypothetical protein
VVKPLDFVTTPDGLGVVYVVNDDIKQASVLLNDDKIHAFGLQQIKLLEYKPDITLKKLEKKVEFLRKQVFG